MGHKDQKSRCDFVLAIVNEAQTAWQIRPHIYLYRYIWALLAVWIDPYNYYKPSQYSQARSSTAGCHPDCSSSILPVAVKISMWLDHGAILQAIVKAMLSITYRWS